MLQNFCPGSALYDEINKIVDIVARGLLLINIYKRWPSVDPHLK